jgi:peptidoglycan hydrolase-like protein with peptidoglycan-binding domain
MARLESQVGLLEERVTQLERAGLGTASAVGLTEAVPGAAAILPAAPSATSKSSKPAGGTASSLKPSTREIQQALKNAGFYQGSVDGKLGPQTRSAIREFQRVHGLADDGVVGRQTWSKLRAYAELSGGGELSAAETIK